jgi:hypothetical protein
MKKKGDVMELSVCCECPIKLVLGGGGKTRARMQVAFVDRVGTLIGLNHDYLTCHYSTYLYSQHEQARAKLID